MSWFSDYSKRIKLIIDSTNIDSDLTDFPILVTLISGTNATAVFDELSTVSGTKKIAITTTVSGIETELYTEIERWDWTNEEANLWVKVPTVSSGTNTELYLYYDSDHMDNTTYIGDTGDTPAQSVWNNSFKAVYHMAQDPNGDVADAIKDSTSNVNHGTPVGAMTSADLVDGKIGKAIEFDGSNDYINCAQNGGLPIYSGSSAYSVSMTVKGATQVDKRVFSEGSTTNNNPLFNIGTDVDGNDAKLNIFIRNDGGVNLIAHLASTNDVFDNTLQYIYWTDNAGDASLYINGSLDATDFNYTPSALTLNITTIGAILRATPVAFFAGIIDEVRVSNTVRSAAWIKATYYSNWNDLINFGAEEICLAFTFTNPTPAHLSIVYGITEQVCLTTTISGEEPNYVYDANFYDEFDVQIGTTVFGIQSGQSAESNVYLSTPSGIDYSWYMTVTSSGVEGTSDTYTFHNRFLYEGYVSENDDPVSRKVNLYYRSTGELIDTTTSSGSNGYYKLSAINNDTHFIVAFDDEAGEDYNALILDKLLPVETE